MKFDKILRAYVLTVKCNLPNSNNRPIELVMFPATLNKPTPNSNSHVGFGACHDGNSVSTCIIQAL